MEQNKYNLLTHICRISGHPVKTLPNTIQQRYLKGLAGVLYNISGGDVTMKTLFTQWGYSITGKDVSSLFTQQSDNCIKNALSVNRVGFRFFRCKHEFFFDCFYLTESYNKSLSLELQEYLTTVGKNFFTKDALADTISFFSGITHISLNVSEAQKKHRETNISFNNNNCNRILVVANVSAGKSTLINALLGYDFNKVKTTACTSRLCKIYNKPIPDGFTYYQSSSLFYDPNIESHCSDDAIQCGMHFESTLGNSRLCLIDTPGVNNSTEEEHWIITKDAIKAGNYDMILFISNGQYNGTTDERRIIEFIYKNSKKPVLFALNQLDRFKISVDNISSMINDYFNEILSIGFKQPKIFPISALYALLIRRKYNLNEDELSEFNLLKKRFSKEYYNLPQYIGIKSTSEIEKTGIIALEKEIINLINEVYEKGKN